MNTLKFPRLIFALLLVCQILSAQLSPPVVAQQPTTNQTILPSDLSEPLASIEKAQHRGIEHITRVSFSCVQFVFCFHDQRPEFCQLVEG